MPAWLVHASVVLATIAGVVGMSTVFTGIMHGNLGEISRGMPLLLPGLWWSGRQLALSMGQSRAGLEQKYSVEGRAAKPPKS